MKILGTVTKAFDVIGVLGKIDFHVTFRDLSGAFNRGRRLLIFLGRLLEGRLKEGGV